MKETYLTYTEGSSDDDNDFTDVVFGEKNERKMEINNLGNRKSGGNR